MMFKKALILGLVLGGMVVSGAETRAGTITYLATGTFDSGGTPTTPTYTSSTDSSTTVTYTSALSSATAPPTSNISLGTFTTASGASPSSTTPVSSGFTLDVTNLGTGDFIEFKGTLEGALSSSSSSAYVVFSSPLSQNLDGYVFTIVNADAGSSGRVNLAAPTTNMGVSTINATVSSPVVPEPASIALLGLALPALATFAYRRRSR